MSIARWDLKEAGGKTLDRRTGSGYEANVRDEKAKIFKVRNLSGTHGRRSDGHKCGRKCALPGEISGVAIKLAPPQGGDDDAGAGVKDCFHFRFFPASAMEGPEQLLSLLD